MSADGSNESTERGPGTPPPGFSQLGGTPPAAPPGVPPGPTAYPTFQAPAGPLPFAAVNPSTATGAQPAAAPGWYPTPDGTTAWWDGTQWLAAPPSQVPGYRRIATLGMLVQVALGVMGAMELFSAWADWDRRQLVDGFFDPSGSVQFQELAAADDRAVTIGVLYLGGLVITAVLMALWSHRIFQNLHGPLGARGLEYTPGWAAGWWFVPIANFFKPKQVMNQAWQASGPDYPAWSTAWNRHKAPALLSWWWAALILSGLIARVSAGSTTNSLAFDREAFNTSTTLSIASSLVGAVAAVLAVLVVQAITTRHSQRAAALAVATA